MNHLRFILAVAFLLTTSPADACDASHAVLKLGHAVVKAEVANTPALRSQGLMYRKKMGANQGMWFVMGGASQNTFWMRNTYIPLDLIFVGYNMVILHIHENARPLDETPIGSPISYWFVLEVPAGFVKKSGVKPGDSIENRPPKC